MPREDFPIESFRHLEGKLQTIRRTVMDKAAELARSKPEGDVYVVTKQCVDAAIRQVLSQPQECLGSIGLSNGHSS